MAYFNRVLSKLKKTEVLIEPVMAAPPSNEMLKDKGVLVIGGSRGIGSAIAVRLSQAGAKVVVTGRNEEELKDLVAKTQIYNYIVMDVGIIENQKDTLSMAERFLGEVNILVNCAGVQSEHERNGHGFFDIDTEDWDYVMDINLKGIYFMCQTYAKHQIDKNIHGKIINICSVTGLKPRTTPYGISKWGVTDLTKGLGALLAPYGIQVNGIAPGMVNTQMMQKELLSNPNNVYRADHPDKRCASVEDIANIALFLASDYSKHIAGEVIVCDGGEINK